MNEQERKNKKIRRSITFEFLVIILLLWAVCLYTIFSSTSVQKLFNELHSDIVPGAIGMFKIKYEATEIKAWTLTYILRGNVIRNDETIKEWLQESWSNLENEAQIHYEHESHIGMEEQQSAEKIVKLSQKLISSSIEIIDLKDQGCESDILFEKIKEDFRSAFYPLREVLDEHAAIHIEELTAAPIKAQSKYRSAVLYIALLGIVVTFLFLFFTLFINKIITNYITGRDLSEQALKESEERFKQLVENANDIIYRLDAKGYLTYVNPVTLKMGNYTKKDLIGKSYLKLVHPDYYHEVKRFFRNQYKKKIKNTYKEFPVKTKSGSYVWLGQNVQLLCEKDKIVGFQAVARDITKRREAEQAIKESEEKFRTLTENINVGIYRNTVGAKGKFIEVNPAIVKMFGFKNKKEFLAYNVSELYLHSEERKKFSDKMLKKGFVKDEELLLKKKDGSPFVGSISAVTIKGNDGNVQFYDGIIEDIIERKKMEEEINRHREQLKLINTILRHDLANNLAVIKSAIRIFKVKKDESILDEASLNIDKSAELIQKMREHESLITKESLKVFEISEVIKQVMENYPDIEFAIKGKKEIFADDALNSVIDNIFRNAVVHGRTNRIDIEIGAYKDRCYVRIADNGTGIPDKIKEKIFDEGFKYGKKAHTGMGLYIVKESVKKWGGSIFVEDNKPKGAVFVLILRSVR